MLHDPAGAFLTVDTRHAPSAPRFILTVASVFLTPTVIFLPVATSNRPKPDVSWQSVTVALAASTLATRGRMTSCPYPTCPLRRMAAIPPSTRVRAGSTATFCIIAKRSVGDALDAGVSVAKNARYWVRIALVVSSGTVGELGLVGVVSGLGDGGDEAVGVVTDVVDGSGPPEVSTRVPLAQPVNASATSSAAAISARGTITGI